MFTSMKLTVAAFSLVSFGAIADTAYEYSDLVTPARVDVGVGVGRGDRRGDVRRGDRVACFAENRGGRMFRAIGYAPERVQDQALYACYNRSVSCRPLGCRWI